MKKNKAAIVGVPVKFTVKKIDRKTLDIQETPARDLLWEAQTPQGFHKDVLVKAHAKKFKGEATDDAILVERMGGQGQDGHGQLPQYQGHDPGGHHFSAAVAGIESLFPPP